MGEPLTVEISAECLVAAWFEMSRYRLSRPPLVEEIRDALVALDIPFEEYT